jgi:hypothetical protein
VEQLRCTLTWLARPTLDAAARVTSGTSSTAPRAASPAALMAEDEAASAGLKTEAMSPVRGGAHMVKIRALSVGQACRAVLM